MTDRDDIIERLAALEAREEARDEVIAGMARKQDTMANKQQEILDQLNRYKGAWGALVMIGAALWAGVKLFLPWFQAKTGG